jgi:hypothetical protein
VGVREGGRDGAAQSETRDGVGGLQVEQQTVVKEEKMDVGAG